MVYVYAFFIDCNFIQEKTKTVQHVAFEIPSNFLIKGVKKLHIVTFLCSAFDMMLLTIMITKFRTTVSTEIVWAPAESNSWCIRFDLYKSWCLRDFDSWTRIEISSHLVYLEIGADPYFARRHILDKKGKWRIICVSSSVSLKAETGLKYTTPYLFLSIYFSVLLDW